jgi:sRNA-binding carbon storage regulator CsrA
MIVISRLQGEAIIIGDNDVLVTILEVNEEEVLLEIGTKDEAISVAGIPDLKATPLQA